MAVSSAGEKSGSVSGGCVEGAVVQEALGILRSQTPKAVAFGISDESAWDVGFGSAVAPSKSTSNRFTERIK